MRKRTTADWVEDNLFWFALAPWGALLTFRIVQAIV